MMMKKYFYILLFLVFSTTGVNAQDNENEFDKKYRFGLRITGQPTWYSTTLKQNKPFGSKFGFGFGLNMEYNFSEIVALSTGIGGDFEGGNYQFNYENGKYEVFYWQKDDGEFVDPRGKNFSNLNIPSNTGYLVDSRSIKTTHVTIPLILKLSTREYSGLKYFGMFGGEVGVRIKTTATDTYFRTYNYSAAGTTIKEGESQGEINLAKDGALPLFPLRVGFNAGLGTEYRLGGSTSAFFSLNYFKSFTNLLRSESKFMVYNIDNSGGTNTYSFVKQDLILNAIRINVGILF